MHRAATTDSVRTAPSLPFDGVIPCQSGATINGPVLGDSGPRSPVRNEAVRLPASFKTNYNTLTRMSPSFGALKISKNPGASSNRAFAAATKAPDERTLPHSNRRALRFELESACHKSLVEERRLRFAREFISISGPTLCIFGVMLSTCCERSAYPLQDGFPARVKAAW